MKPFRMAVLTLSLLPLVALSAPPEQVPDAERAERIEQRMRTKRVVTLATQLELDEAQALRMAETMRQFDERRRSLRVQVRESAQVLRRAAQGDTSAESQVDQAVQRAFDARAQLAALDREMYQSLAKDLPPQKRARLALFMARQGDKMGKMMKKLDREERRKHKKMRGPDGGRN
jgi:hypothetical protein